MPEPSFSPISVQQRELLAGAPVRWVRALFPAGTVTAAHARDRLQRLVASVPSLRTRLESNPRFGVVQSILEATEVEFVELAFDSPIDAAEPAIWASIEAEDPVAALDLGSPVRAAWVAATDGCFLALAAARVVCDERSLRIAGECILTGAEAPAAPAYVDYVDFCLERSSDEHAEDSREFFDRLANEPPSDALPTVRAPRAGGLGRAARKIPIAADALAGDADAVVGAAFARVLAVTAGTAHATFDWYCLGRDLEEVRNALGPFARWLPTTSRVPATATWERAVAELSDAFGLLEERLELFDRDTFVADRRDAGWDPARSAFAFFDNCSFSRTPSRPTALGPTPPPGAELVVTAWLERDGLHVEAVVDTRAHEPVVAEYVIDRLEATLMAALADPATRLDRLPQVGDREREQLLGAMRTGPVTKRYEGTLPLAIARHARERPASEAVCDSDDRFTYAELWQRAGRIASALERAGVRRGAVVPVVMHRSAHTVAAFVGVWRAGAAYTPVDPGYPDDRVAAMLETLGAEVALTTNDLASKVASWGVRAVSVEDCERTADAAGAAAEDEADVEARRPDPDDAAYVLFTSGSTGRPKGVEVTHANLVASCLSRTDLFGGPHGRTLLVYSCAFDSAVAAIHSTLVDGGTVVVAASGEEYDPRAIARRIELERVSHLFCNPNQWRWVLAEGDTRALDSLEIVAVADEECTPDVVRLHFEVLPGVTLVNEYGPTETTVWCSAHFCDASDGSAKRVPIGAPIANSSIYVLDERLEPAPVGAIGEIWVGGDGVSRGYHRAPALTAERFLPELDPSRPGARMYRTGDLGRFLPDGALEFFGRADRQVKLRGYRIELEEVDRALLRTDGVREAISVIQDVDRRPALVSYYGGDAAASEERVRRDVRARLPAYMVPSRVVRLERLPRNEHGKVDPKRLALPEAAVSIARPPVTHAERVLAAAFCRFLPCDAVGVDQSFFDLGGDSIAAIQVRAAAEEAGLTFSLVDLMKHPSIAELVPHCRGLVGARVPKAPQPFELLSQAEIDALPSGLADAYPLTELQLGMLARSAVGRLADYHDQTQLHLRTEFDPARFRRALSDVIARHPVLRTSFDLRAKVRPLQYVHARSVVPLEIVEAPDLTDARYREWAEAERVRPFDWKRAPLFRVHVHLLSRDEVRLTWTFHHAIVDGWSNAQFAVQLFGRYRELETPAIDRPLPTPLASMHASVRAELDAVADESARRYFVTHLQGLAPAAVDRSSEDFVEDWTSVPAELVEELEARAQMLRVPLRSLLLAVYLRALAALRSSPEVVTGVVRHVRQDGIDTESALGLFLNVLPLRMHVEDESWRAWIARVFLEDAEQTRYRCYPLASLQKDFGQGAIFASTFNYTDFHAYDAAVADDRIEVVDAAFIDRNPVAFSVLFARDARAPGRLRFRLKIGRDQRAVLVEMQELLAALLHEVATGVENAPFGQRPVRAPTPNAEDSPPAAAATDASGSVFERIARVAEDDPARPAIVEGSTATAYGELVARSRALAAALVRWGVGPGQSVGLCIERSSAWVIAALAIWRTGAHYVALDPEGPAERIARQLAGLGTTRVLSSETTRGLFAAAEVDARTTDELEALSPSMEDEPFRADPALLAYVIHTSGSTGRPKAVGVPHSALEDHLAWRRRRFPMAPSDAFLHKASSTFDISVWEVFAALSMGSRVVLAGPLVHRNPRALAALIRAAAVSDVHFHPSLLREALHLGALSNCPTLRRVYVGGEKLPKETARLFREQCQAALIHQYGPTETTIDVTAFACDAIDHLSEIPIGSPIDGATLRVVDERDRPVLPGQTGELLIGGTGLSWGYLNDARLTAERFVPDDRASVPGSRLYRSGDLVRMTTDSLVCFVGRRDDQIKLHGHRIELGEIEHVLASAPHVARAAVVVRDGVLAAHVEGRGVDVRALLARCEANLPPAMVPSSIDVWDALPLSPSLKVDRSRLRSARELRTDLVGPEGPIEASLLEILRTVLGRSDLGVTSDFFESGGSSLSALRLLALVEAEVGVEVPLELFFETPTVRAVAAWLDAQPRAHALATASTNVDDLAAHDLDQMLRTLLGPSDPG